MIQYVHNYDLAVFGSYPAVLIGLERGEDYKVEVGFLSGYFDQYRVVEFDIELNFGTAGKNATYTSQCDGMSIRFPGPEDVYLMNRFI